MKFFMYILTILAALLFTTASAVVHNDITATAPATPNLFSPNIKIRMIRKKESCKESGCDRPFAACDDPKCVECCGGACGK
jgi:hypothetical protein